MRERERERERVHTAIPATFLINIFFLLDYVNIQPSCSKTRMEYFNIKIRLLIRDTQSGQVKQGKLSKSKCLVIVFVIFSFCVTKRTQNNSGKNIYLIKTKAVKYKV